LFSYGVGLTLFNGRLNKMDFYKYEGAGNDFILMDDRNNAFPENDNDLIRRLCDRRFGIGADGLMLLRSEPGYDFRMIYFNSDGKAGSMCGNGGRCITALAFRLGIIRDKASFIAADGEHLAELTADEYVRLKMTNVKQIETGEGYTFLNTGSPHYVIFLTNLSAIDVFGEGRKIRYNERFREIGTNVDFVEDHGKWISVRTYERGVENETLACGTGVVASAICTSVYRKSPDGIFSLPVKALGGNLMVSFLKKQQSFSDIWLEGPATFVFTGTIRGMDVNSVQK
jgi:diaminopimelate epimerase